MNEIIESMSKSISSPDQISDAKKEAENIEKEIRYTSERMTELENSLDKLSETHVRYRKKADRVAMKLRRLSDELQS